jgi:hypothetical protein
MKLIIQNSPEKSMLPEHGDSEHACDPSSQEVEIGGS